MTTRTIRHTSSPSGLTTLYAFPVETPAHVAYDLADWSTYRVALTESGTSALYSGAIDDEIALEWLIFDGQPSKWNESIASIDFKLAAIKEQTDLIGTGDGAGVTIEDSSVTVE